ncbi:MAG: hypothetical protein IPN33_22285 [Saprospiraceae bacterium]|nr:hypothetical protein [Saprospiraceae bacterium]
MSTARYCSSYGAGTGKAYEAVKLSNRELRKYLLLAQHGETGVNDRLQQAIDNLVTDPRLCWYSRVLPPLSPRLTGPPCYPQPGADNEVNRLMNAALKETYGNRPFKTPPPFDYRSTYAYQDLDQLILHLYYVHSSPGMTYSVPCWMNDRHPASRVRPPLLPQHSPPANSTQSLRPAVAMGRNPNNARHRFRYATGQQSRRRQSHRRHHPTLPVADYHILPH